MFPLQPGTGRFIPVNSVNQVTAGPTSSSLSQARDMSPNKWHASAINLPRNQGTVVQAKSMTLRGRSWFLPFSIQAPVGLLQLSALQTGESLVVLWPSPAVILKCGCSELWAKEAVLACPYRDLFRSLCCRNLGIPQVRQATRSFDPVSLIQFPKH